MSRPNCLLFCQPCEDHQLVPMSATTVVRVDQSTMICWACPTCFLGRVNLIPSDEGDVAEARGARTAGTCMMIFRQCGGCDTVTALPMSAFTVFQDATTSVLEWTCTTCSPVCTNSFTSSGPLVEMMKNQGATSIVTDLVEVE